MITQKLYAPEDLKLSNSISNSKKARKHIYEIVADATEMPADAVSRIPVFTIRGTREIEIDGCDGILSYDGCRVSLSAHGKPVTVIGDGLMLSNFTGNALSVRGEIYKVMFYEVEKCSEV